MSYDMNRVRYHYNRLRNKYCNYNGFSLSYLQEDSDYDVLRVDFKGNIYILTLESTGRVSLVYNLLKNKEKVKKRFGYSVDNMAKFLMSDIARRVKEEYR